MKIFYYVYNVIKFAEISVISFQVFIIVFLFNAIFETIVRYFKDEYFLHYSFFNIVNENYF